MAAGRRGPQALSLKLIDPPPSLAQTRREAATVEHKHTRRAARHGRGHDHAAGERRAAELRKGRYPDLEGRPPGVRGGPGRRRASSTPRALVSTQNRYGSSEWAMSRLGRRGCFRRLGTQGRPIEQGDTHEEIVMRVVAVVVVRRCGCRLGRRHRQRSSVGGDQVLEDRPGDPIRLKPWSRRSSTATRQEGRTEPLRQLRHLATSVRTTSKNRRPRTSERGVEHPIEQLLELDRAAEVARKRLRRLSRSRGRARPRSRPGSSCASASRRQPGRDGRRGPRAGGVARRRGAARTGRRAVAAMIAPMIAPLEIPLTLPQAHCNQDGALRPSSADISSESGTAASFGCHGRSRAAAGHRARADSLCRRSFGQIDRSRVPVNQLVHPRNKDRRRGEDLARGAPQKRGVCTRVYDDPEEAELGASQGRARPADQRRWRSTTYIPGEGHNLQEHSVVPHPRRPRQGPAGLPLQGHPRRRSTPSASPTASRRARSTARSEARRRCRAAQRSSRARSMPTRSTASVLVTPARSTAVDARRQEVDRRAASSTTRSRSPPSAPASRRSRCSSRRVKTVTPVLEVRSRRVGGAQLPGARRGAAAPRPHARDPLDRARSRASAARRGCTRSSPASSWTRSNQQGGAFKKKDDIYRMAQANKAFAHYRW